jgi:toxin FitB
MGQIVLDTDVVSLHYKQRLPAKVRQHMLGQTRYITFATAGELRKWQVTRDWGWARRTGLQLRLDSKWVLPYNRRVAWTWGRIAARAMRRGRTLPANDLWIAACCIERRLPLLTMNRRHFEDLERQEGLRSSRRGLVIRPTQWRSARRCQAMRC